MIRILQKGDGPATADIGGSLGSRSSASVHEDNDSDSDFELSSQESSSNHGSLPRPNKNESLNYSHASSDHSHHSSQSHHYTDATTASYASRQPELESSYCTRHPPTIRISRQNQPEPASNG